ncbi:MAG TPA: GNAT family N-acetyltransferase [Phototrophicaceae bacterium]|nr:GNAT family N-acetyltransferase [Phototrophicaceae bacterium]
MTDSPLALNAPSTSFLIRPVTPQDAEPLQQNCWTTRSTAGIIHLINRAQQNTRRKRGLGAVVIEPETGLPLGFGQLILWSECGEISDLIVAESQRRRGIGTAIIQYLIQYAREINLSCVEIGVALSNPNALRLYRYLGFKDNYTLSLDIGNGTEPILYLKLLV